MRISAEERVVLNQPRIRLAVEKPRLGFGARIRQGIGLGMFTLLFLVGAVVMIVAQVCTLFLARRFYAEVIAKYLARMGLRLLGIRLVVHDAERLVPGGGQPVVYISNHTSALDAFVIIALGLPNARYFMGGFLRTLLPLWIIAGAMGTFWTPRQLFPEKRRALFQRVAKKLGRTGESVFLTPEGQRCWQFNKGAFHLALSLEVPVVPMFISIPAETDPGPWTGMERIDIRPGVVEVHVGDALETDEWTEENLDVIRGEVRGMYVDWAMALGDKSAGAL